MSKASILMDRVLSEMESRKLYAYYRTRVHNKLEEIPDYHNPQKVISVMETWNRNNGTEENDTVTIEVDVPISKYANRRVLRIRVPKNASDRVISKRIDELEKFVKEAF